MIKPEQIPIASMNLYFKSLHDGKSHEDCVAAAINAWPGAWGECDFASEWISLPLPEEKNDV